MRHRNKVAAALAALAMAAVLAACGSGDEDKSDAVSGQFEAVAGAPAAYRDISGEATLERADGGTETSLAVTGLEPSTAYVAHLHRGSCGETDPGGAHFKFDPNGSGEPPNEVHLEFESGPDGSGSAEASSDREVPAGAAGALVLHEAEEEQGGEEDHTAAAAEAGEAVLVHEGHHHGEPSPPAKIACAELEGGEAEAAAAGPTIVVREGEPVDGIEKLEYKAGEMVKFSVESDVAEEVHVHGYDMLQVVPAGGEVSFEFPAEIEGIFEVELEGLGVQIAELRVNP